MIVLIIITVGTLASSLAGPPGAVSILGILGFWRVLLSGVITAEFADADIRGMMVAAVFAMQGIGILLAAVISVAVVAILQSGIKSVPVYWLDISIL